MPEPCPFRPFFSEHGGGSENEQCKDELGGLSEMTQPELSTEDLVVRESLLSYFWDVLRRLGPVKINGPELQAELDHLSEDGKQLVGRHSDIAAFIGQSSQLVLIDDMVCAKEDVERARKIALESIVLSVAARNTKATSVAPGPPVSTPAPATVWNSQSPLTASIKAINAAAATSEANDLDPWLQTPKVDSLFNYDSGTANTSSTSNLLSSSSNNFPGLSSHLKQPDLSSPPPSIQRSSSASTSNGFSASIANNFSAVSGVNSVSAASAGNGFSVTSTSSGSSRFGGLGPASNTVPFVESSSQTNIETLNRRLQGLSLCNADLLTQLANKERQLQHFSKLIAPQEELESDYEKVKQELEEAKKELIRLQGLLEANEGERNKETLPSGASDNYLIISLQHQLESERLNSRNLKHQLELERTYSSKVTEKHNFLLNRFHSTGTPGPGSPIRLGDTSAGLRQTDSFGLRGLLANTSSVFRDEPSSRFSVGGAAVTPPTSTSLFVGSGSVMNKPPNSSTFSSSSTPLQLNSVNFSSSFGGSGAELSLRGDEFQRRMTGPSSRVVLPSATQALVNSINLQSNKQ